MSFEVVHARFGGRVKGQPNKVSIESAEEIKRELKKKGIDYLNLFFASWAKIENPEVKATLILRFMEYIHPRQRHLQMSMSLEDAIKVVEDAIAESGQTPRTVESVAIESTGSNGSL